MGNIFYISQLQLSLKLQTIFLTRRQRVANEDVRSVPAFQTALHQSNAEKALQLETSIVCGLTCMLDRRWIPSLQLHPRDAIL